MGYQEVLYEVDDPVATITLNRPDKLNALTLRTIEELRNALADAERSEAVVGTVLTGAGRGFCAGLDLATVQQMQRSGTTDISDASPELARIGPVDPVTSHDFDRGYSFVMSLAKPVIAAINGPSVGLGFSIAMFCDLRFMSSTATLSTSFAQLGLVAEHGMGWVLPRLIGTAKALDVLWTGRRIGAEEALSLGLVDRVVEPERLLEEAQGYVRNLASTASPTSMMHIKRQVYSYLMQPLGPAMKDTESLQDRSMTWPDLPEGIAAFSEKRAPKFPRVGGGE